MSKIIPPHLQKKYQEHCTYAMTPLSESSWMDLYNTNSELRQNKVKVTKATQRENPLKAPLAKGKFKCTGCKEHKPIREFPTCNRTKRGHKSKCKDCMAIYQLEWYHKNKSKRSKV